MGSQANPEPPFHGRKPGLPTRSVQNLSPKNRSGRCRCPDAEVRGSDRFKPGWRQSRRRGWGRRGGALDHCSIDGCPDVRFGLGSPPSRCSSSTLACLPATAPRWQDMPSLPSPPPGCNRHDYDHEGRRPSPSGSSIASRCAGIAPRAAGFASSPCDGQASPCERQASPCERQASPRVRQLSPCERQASPRVRQSSPRERPASRLPALPGWRANAR